MKRVSFVMPSNLAEKLHQEVEETGANRSDILREALYARYNMEAPEKLHITRKRDTLHRERDQLLKHMELREVYDFSTLRELTGFSRKMLQEILEDYEEYFSIQEVRGVELYRRLTRTERDRIKRGGE